MIGRLEKKESSIPSRSKGVAETNQMGCAANHVVGINGWNMLAVSPHIYLHWEFRNV